MDYKLLLLIFILSCNCKIGNTSVLDWIWQTKKNEPIVQVADGVPLISIPYESKTQDEKFLQEAAKFTDIQVSSPLETCQHKVIMKVKTSCSDMTEEELAKLSVNLLNCQSAVEGRKMFPCTEEMSIKQCTTDMDADMWNAYHLISNRARAVCYAARNTQFRALTELTVNKLMQSAHSQIEALSSLKQSHAHLEEQTMDALSSLSKGNKVLLEQQQYLKDAQVTAHNIVTTNLKELNNEKALIRSGHAQLAVMAEDIRNKLEKAHKDLEQQATEREENHQEVLQDLINIQEQARLIWEKIEFSTNHILNQHQETIEQYEETMQKLVQINDTIQYIWNITNTMRLEIDQKLGWITDYIGDTGEQVQRVYRIFLHIVYILVAMIVAAFLQAPFLTRATIMGIVPVNLITYLKHGIDGSLDFISMTVLIILITIMHFVMLGIQQMFGTRISKVEPINTTHEKEHLNGDMHKYTSSSYSNSMPKTRLYARLMEKIREFYNFIISKIDYYREKINVFIKSIVTWDRSNLNTHEELSCSYQPTKKKHEDIIYDYEPAFTHKSWMSENDMECDSSNKTMPSLSEYVDDNDLTDAYELKYRGVDKFKSVTPLFPSPRITCVGITRNGKKCRAFASPGLNYCYRHSTGTSIVNNSAN